MNRTDRLRLWVVLIVVAAALCFVYFNRDGLNLGLDLRGGAHIVLQAKDTPENPLGDDSIDRLLAVLRNRQNHCRPSRHSRPCGRSRTHRKNGTDGFP